MGELTQTYIIVATLIVLMIIWSNKIQYVDIVIRKELDGSSKIIVVKHFINMLFDYKYSSTYDKNLYDNNIVERIIVLVEKEIEAKYGSVKIFKTYENVK